ncbi:MAG: hypothetical protein L6R40_007232 [Gallowayella cf. fulva]|nr:MAG: hypothetical protein L6R40_007232 [Xanthomendoza cf. fulva]
MLPPRKRDPDDPDDREKRDLQVPADPKAMKIICAPGTTTFIKLTRNFRSDDLMTDTKVQEQIRTLIAEAHHFIQRSRIGNSRYGDVINDDKNYFHEESLGWIWETVSPHANFKLQVANAHRKKPVPGFHFGTMKIVGEDITWQVLDTALQSLGEYMSIDKYGMTECELEIWDGPVQVGSARVIRN